MFEEGLKLIYPDSYVNVTAEDFMEGLKYKDKLKVLNNALLVTVGDEIKHLIYDREGNILNGLSPEKLNTYA